MTEWRIPLYKIHWDENDIEGITGVIRKGMFWTGGPSVVEFEKEISDVSEKKYAVSFNSGTSGLHAILLALGIGPGDEVIVPSFTFISTCNVVLHVGAKPVFVEIEPITYGLDPQDVKSKITANTKAIIPVHYGGGPCKIDELRDIADETGVFLIEDAAESLGASFRGTPVGSFGLASMYSFCGNKVLTTGEGGIVVTDNEEIRDSLKLVRSHGRTDRGDYFSSSKSFDYISLGYNWRMSDIVAELGRSQLKKLDFLSEKRNEVANVYDGLLDSLPLRIPNRLPDASNVFQMYTIRFDSHKLREKVREALTQKRIMTKVYFDCAHLTSYYSKMFGTKKGMLPITEKISSEVLSLPIYPNMAEEDIHFVSNTIRDATKKS